MIIDIHSHLAYAHIYPEFFLSNMFVGLNEIEKIRLNKLLPMFLKDKDGTVFLKQMDEAKIEKAVLLIIDCGITLGEAKLNLEEIYRIHYNILKKFPDRFIVFAGIDPRRGEKGMQIFKSGILNYGFRGLKLYPPMGFSVNDSRLHPYYEICEDLHLVVLVHTGPSLQMLNNKYTNPIDITDIAKKYRNINFILAHAGCNLNSELTKRVTELPNVYLDISGFQSTFNNVKCSIDELSYIFRPELNKKILFGTDWPLFNLMRPVLTQIQQLETIYERAENKDQNALQNILANNAFDTLRLSK